MEQPSEPIPGEETIAEVTTEEKEAAAPQKGIFRLIFAVTAQRLKALIAIGLILSMLHVLTTNYKYLFFIPNLILCVLATFALGPGYRKTRIVFLVFLGTIALGYLCIAIFVIATVGNPAATFIYWIIGDTPVAFAVGGFLQTSLLLLCAAATVRLMRIYKSKKKVEEEQKLLEKEVAESGHEEGEEMV